MDNDVKTKNNKYLDEYTDIFLNDILFLKFSSLLNKNEEKLIDSLHAIIKNIITNKYKTKLTAHIPR